MTEYQSLGVAIGKRTKTPALRLACTGSHRLQLRVHRGQRKLHFGFFLKCILRLRSVGVKFSMLFIDFYRTFLFHVCCTRFRSEISQVRWVVSRRFRRNRQPRSVGKVFRLAAENRGNTSDEVTILKTLKVCLYGRMHLSV